MNDHHTTTSKTAVVTFIVLNTHIQIQKSITGTKVHKTRCDIERFAVSPYFLLIG